MIYNSIYPIINPVFVLPVFFFTEGILTLEISGFPIMDALSVFPVSSTQNLQSFVGSPLLSRAHGALFPQYFNLDLPLIPLAHLQIEFQERLSCPGHYSFYRQS